MAQLNFDARTVAPDAGQQDPIPAGWYNVVIDKSEMKPTKDGTGMRLELQFKVLDGQYANRKVFEGLNLKNANAVAQEIAYKQLSAIAHAVRVLMVEDSSQLHNIPMKIKVKLRPADGKYEAGNSVVAYKDINEVVTQPGAVTTPTAPAAFAPPPPAFAPPPAQAWAPPAAPAAPQWAPPAAAQPWAAPAAPVAPQWAPPAPVAQVPTAPAQWAPPLGATAPAPWAAPQAPAPVATQATAPIAAPAPNPVAGVVPPWLAQPTA